MGQLAEHVAVQHLDRRFGAVVDALRLVDLAHASAPDHAAETKGAEHPLGERAAAADALGQRDLLARFRQQRFALGRRAHGSLELLSRQQGLFARHAPEQEGKQVQALQRDLDKGVVGGRQPLRGDEAAVAEHIRHHQDGQHQVRDGARKV